MTQDDARKALLARQEALAREEAANADASDTVELQQDAVGRLSRMDALQGQAMAQATQRRRVAEGLRIKAALQRIDEGEWGYCVGCGEEIAQGRLRHDPSTPTCIKCAV